MRALGPGFVRIAPAPPGAVATMGTLMALKWCVHEVAPHKSDSTTFTYLFTVNNRKFAQYVAENNIIASFQNHHVGGGASNPGIASIRRPMYGRTVL